jgi:hypothetical protein
VALEIEEPGDRTSTRSRLLTNADLSELKTVVAEHVETRKRPARVAALQRKLDRMFALAEARAADYEHEGTAASTGMLGKD